MHHFVPLEGLLSVNGVSCGSISFDECNESLMMEQTVRLWYAKSGWFVQCYVYSDDVWVRWDYLSQSIWEEDTTAEGTDHINVDIKPFEVDIQ